MTAGLPGTDFITIKTSRLTLLEQWALTTDEPLVKSIEFQEEEKVFEAILRDGQTVCFPLALFPELQNAEIEQLHNVVAIGMGSALEWPSLNAHYGVNNLVRELQQINIVKAKQRQWIAT